MYYGTEQADADADPPNGGIGAVDVIHLASKPDAQKAAQLVREEHNPIERAHITQPIDMSDQA